MTISGASLYSSMYTSSTNWSQYLSTQNTEESEQGMQGMQGAGGPKGPGGPGGGPGGPPPKIDLDTDSDGLWSETEISDFASSNGLSIDAEDIISNYDADGDGQINNEESELIRQENGLKMPPPHEMTQMRQGFSSTTESESTDSSELISQMMQAYLSQSGYQSEVMSILDVAL